MEGKMSPFIYRAGWQAICRRVIEWQRGIGTRSELMLLADHDPDLPVSRAEAGLVVQKCCWQP
jgi:uncharacterized protein YjiS (DUF1127 family)